MKKRKGEQEERKRPRQKDCFHVVQLQSLQTMADGGGQFARAVEKILQGEFTLIR